MRHRFSARSRLLFLRFGRLLGGPARATADPFGVDTCCAPPARARDEHSGRSDEDLRGPSGTGAPSFYTQSRRYPESGGAGAAPPARSATEAAKPCRIGDVQVAPDTFGRPWMRTMGPATPALDHPMDQACAAQGVSQRKQVSTGVMTVHPDRVMPEVGSCAAMVGIMTESRTSDERCSDRIATSVERDDRRDRCPRLAIRRSS